MNQERKPLWIGVGVGCVVVLALWLWPRVEEELAPQPQAAWVAVQVAGEDFAEVGWRHLERGTPFTLHAVLEARDRDGSAVYYTEAPGLRLGGDTVPASALKRWDRRQEPKILWFTVEAGYPYRELQQPEQLQRFDLEEVYRPSWPDAWSIPGELAPSWAQDRGALYGSDGAAFGTQRYHVRIEVYGDREDLLPEARFKSWGSASLPQQLERFPTVTVYVPGRLRPASEVFALAQLEPPLGAAGMLEQVAGLSEQRLAFSRLTVVVEMLEALGLEPARLSWQPLDLRSAPRWGETVEAGDMLQVLDRLVLLYEDRGEPGLLDGPDLCFDFARGAAVRRLQEIFAGEGEVNWASLDAASKALDADDGFVRKTVAPEALENEGT